MTALPTEHPLFREIADIAPVMIWMSGLDKLCNYFNGTWLQFTGAELKDEIGNGWTSRIHPDDLGHCMQLYEKSFEARIPFAVEYRLRRHDGEYRWILDNGKPLFSINGQFMGYAGSCVDITERMELEHQLQKLNAELESKILERTRQLAESNAALVTLSKTDALTGLNNRLAADQRIGEEFSRSKRNSDIYSVIMLDIDRFKRVNDEYGHLVGDDVLRFLSEVFRRNLRQHDFVGRYGGEEFIFILPSTRISQATAVAEKIRQAVNDSPHPTAGQITVSIGVSEVSLDHENQYQAIRQADHWLYEAKRLGRNRIAY